MRSGLFSSVEKLDMKRSINKDKPDCLKCKLKNQCNNIVHAYGSFKKQIMVIGEAPDEEEDFHGIPFCGTTGDLTKMLFNNLDLSLEEDCVVLNSIQCRPKDKIGNNRKPTTKEINYCRSYVLHQIKKYKPKLIIALGGSAMQSLLADRWYSQEESEWKINRWRGYCPPDQDLECYICPTFHPAFLLRNEGSPSYKIIEKLFIDDISFGLHIIENTQFNKYITKPIIIKKEEEIIYLLKKLLSFEDDFLLTYDYETNSLKPLGKGKRIYSCSFSVDPTYGYAFPITDKIIKYWREVLKKKNIFKTAHNMKFEDMWSRKIIGTHVINLCFDSILGAHILDNRRNSVGAKFQTYINFGIPDYSSNITRFLSAENGMAINQIDRIPLNDLLIYNAYDSIFEFGFTLRMLKKIKLNNILNKYNKNIGQILNEKYLD